MSVLSARDAPIGAHDPYRNSPSPAPSNDGPTAKPWVLDIAAYVAGEGSGASGQRLVKLSSNENPLGPSPRATDAFRQSADHLGLYPDGAAAGLRGAIASVHEIDPDRIVCGAGSDELIALLCQAYCASGDEVLHSAHGFAMYAISARAAGAAPVAAPERALTADPEALLAAITDKTRIIFLANPNNPTGTYLDRAALTAFADAIPSSTLLVLDGAYAEYMRADDYECGLKLAETRANVVTTRTFSKIHGLAALRVGWLYGPPSVVDAVHRVRGPFNVSAPALAAAEAAVRDVHYAGACAIQNEVWRDWLTKELRRIGLETPDSHANFVLPRFAANGPNSAAAADAFLRTRGYVVRRMESYGLPDRLRITVGASNDMVGVAAALSAFMTGAEAVD